MGHAEQLGISPASWALSGVIWDSSQVLAHLMADYHIDGLRILELGCGLGLSSLLLNKREADITATDYHTEAGAWLRENVRLNQDDAIPYTRTNWKDKDDRLGKFDLIIGSDVLYESGHSELLAGFIARHARPTSTVIIVDPGRRQRAKFTRHMSGHGFCNSQHVPETATYLDSPFSGSILTYARQGTDKVTGG